MYSNHVTILDWIGFFGPILLWPVAALALYKNPYVLVGYIIFNIIEIAINKILKNRIREPRPSRPLFFFKEEGDHYKDTESFGMPSGHAQNSAFTVAYLFFALKRPASPIMIVSYIIYALTLYQRWKYRRHTILQLLVGSVLGFIIAWTGIQIMNQIRGNPPVPPYPLPALRGIPIHYLFP